MPAERSSNNYTPSGRFRAQYILAHLERAVVQAHGRAACEGYRSILAEEAKRFASCRMNRRPDRLERLKKYEGIWVDIVGSFSPQQWTWRPPAGPPEPRTKFPVVKWWLEGHEERPAPRLQLVR